ncbi:hypothetical protein [Moritella sp. 28]|uniref:hypothetical protein n=1 Tax=Moritella sp. 28 TaxID=2746232 RepID=UPI001BA8AFB3|nr:hypothetical protein [Moritella sp. 28]QUM84472.1 hypothetical protein HWV02_08115 [Moritella sp. 28]
MHYILLILIPVISLTIFKCDDALSPTATKWLESIEQNDQAESQSFLYLNGIMASADADVIQFGRERLELLNQQQNPDILKTLVMPQEENPLYCRFSKADCFDYVVNNDTAWVAELKQHGVLLTRYRKYLSFRDFRSLVGSSMLIDYEVIESLRSANRLALLESLTLAAEQSPSSAVQLLIDDTHNLYQQFPAIDDFVLKLILGNLLANNLDIIAYISDKYNYHADIDLPYLTVDELSFKNMAIREFGWEVELYRSLDGSPDLFNKDGHLPRWIANILFKPNMTINGSIPATEYMIAMSELTAEEFAKMQLDDGEDDEEQGVDFFNPVGSVLNSLARPSYHAQMARLHDLNGKISLVNSLLEGKNSLEGKSIKFSNPYYPNADAYSINGNKICLSGPFEDTDGIRCVRYSRSKL